MLWGAIRIETSDGRYRFVEYLWGALVSSYEGSGLALRASVFLPNIILPSILLPSIFLFGVFSRRFFPRRFFSDSVFSVGVFPVCFFSRGIL